MNLRKTLVFIAASAMLAVSCTPKPGTRWSVEKAQAWYAEHDWLVGCDYIPASAINQIEMWSADTYDRDRIVTELAAAQELGFNTLRVFLSSVVWQNDPEGFKSRVDDFLSICEEYGIKPLLVFLDDCWNNESEYGLQPVPVQGRHNSGWVQDPSCARRADTTTLYPQLHAYVKDVMGTFKDDSRILLWDLYNEPGNTHHEVDAVPMLRHMFEWGREVNPSQPLTVGVWTDKADELNRMSLEESDIISYHSYSKPDTHEALIKHLRMHNRPLICTEYMARTHGSTFQSILPLLKKFNVGAVNWGFVDGKTNTKYSWEKEIPSGEEPELWFHDILRSDLTPYSQEEVDFIREITARK